MNEKNKLLRDKVSTIILTDESLRDYVASIISKSTGIDYDLIAKTLGGFIIWCVNYKIYMPYF